MVVNLYCELTPTYADAPLSTYPVFNIHDMGSLSDETLMAIINRGCLVGFNPTAGFFEELHKLMTDNLVEGNTFILHYSDNINLFSCTRKAGGL